MVQKWKQKSKKSKGQNMNDPETNRQSVQSIVDRTVFAHTVSLRDLVEGDIGDLR